MGLSCFASDDEEKCCPVGGWCRTFTPQGLRHGGSRWRPLTASACLSGSLVCDDPHMDGLRGQKIEWSGEDGGWYSLIQDIDLGLQINVRVTAPLPQEFPNRQLVTGVSVLSEKHSFVVEVEDPCSVETSDCLNGGVSPPCLANGALQLAVDDDEDRPGAALNSYLDTVEFHDGLNLSVANLPVECWQFGGGNIWASMFEEMMQGQRDLSGESFEEWLLRFRDMAAPDWCTKYVLEHGLADVQSTHALLRIETPMVSVRVSVGTNHQGGGEKDWDGTVLSDLDFWQMKVGLEGLRIEDGFLSGILGETSRPAIDDTTGKAVMSGPGAIRGTVEDYRVSGALGIDFVLDKGL